MDKRSRFFTVTLVAAVSGPFFGIRAGDTIETHLKNLTNNTDVQTTLVPAGGATVVEFELEVLGNHLLVDHAPASMLRGLIGYLIAEGLENPEIFQGTPMPGSGH